MSVRKEVWKKKDDAGKPYTIEAYRVDFVVELPDGHKLRTQKASANWNRREAEEWERRKRWEILNPSPTKKDAPTVAVFFDEWITTDCVARGNRASTIPEKQGDYRRYIGPLLGHLRLDQITFRELTAFVAKLLAADLQPKSARNTAGTLRRMLVYAAKLGHIIVAPEFPDLKVPRTSKFDFFSRAEISSSWLR